MVFPQNFIFDRKLLDMPSGIGSEQILIIHSKDYTLYIPKVKILIHVTIVIMQLLTFHIKLFFY
jgi:hypothetical protein